MGEISQRTWWLLAAIVTAVVAVTVFLQAGELGFFEPWESTVVRADVEETGIEIPDRAEKEEPAEIDVEAALDSRAVPTLDGEPMEVSWLTSWWTSMVVDQAPVVETGGVGEIERQTRLPLIALMVILVGAAMFWGRRHLGDGAGAMTAVVLATSPVVMLGAIFLSGPLVSIAASALALMALFQSVYGDDRSLLWAVGAAAALGMVALDGRLVGVVSVLAVAVAMAVARAVDDETGAGEVSGIDSIWAGVAAAGFIGLIGWGLWTGTDYEEGLFRPDVLQLVWVLGPAVLLGGFAMAARRSRFGEALVGLRGLIFAAGGVLPLVVLGLAYGNTVAAEPELAEAGRPALAYLLEHYQLAEEVEASGDFAWWWRQVGFGLFPYLMFLIPAAGYLVWRLQTDSGADENERAVATLCLVWPVAVFVVLALAADLGHTTYSAFFPMALAIGWMLSDGEFWQQVRIRPAIYLAMAAIAIFTLVILTGDLEDFPQRLVGYVLGGAEEPGIPDEFVEKTAVETWGRAMMIAVAAYFAGIVSWMAFAWRDGKRFVGWLRGLTTRIPEWWRRRGEEEGDEAGGVEPDGKESRDENEEAGLVGQRRMAARESWRDGEGRAARLARRLERLPGLIGLAVAGGLGFGAVLFGSVTVELDDELSSRAVVEQYLQSVDDEEEIWWFEIDEIPDHFYTRGVDEQSERRAFSRRYEDDERYFALIPEDEMARVHSRVRRNHDENMPVLATGGGLALVSNQLADEETDVNPISKYVLDEPDGDYIPLEYEADGQKLHPEFDDRIKFLGYRLDRGGPDEMPVYSWGDKLEVTQYFQVERRVPRSYEMFVHIDLGGNRIHGDHDPAGGLYPTSRWREGDVVKNVHEIEIERFSAPGIYTFYTGFYSGDDRMSVEPDEAHDGDDRVEMTRIEVVPF